MAAQDSFDSIFNMVINSINRGSNPYADVLCGLLKTSRKVIEVEYNTTNKRTKDRFMQHKDEPLDRHKCAAAFMVAILKKIKIEALERMPQVSKLVREKIAIQVGLGIVVTMIRDADNKDGGRMIKYWDDNNNKINYPPPQCDEGAYVHNWALELYYDRVDGTLSVLAIANILFLIEAYNRQIANGYRHNSIE